MAVISIKNKVRSGNLLAGNAYYVPPSYESIATVTSTGSVTSITFSSIPSTYQHLQLRILSRSARSAATDTIYMRFNSDSGTNYSYHNLTGNGSSASAGGYAPDTIMFVATTPAASAASGIFGVSIVDIHNYASTTQNKTVRVFDGYDANGSGTVELRSNAWYNTAAVSTIFLANYQAADIFPSGTVFSLYGIKG